MPEPDDRPRCPACRRVLDASTAVLPGCTILRCGECKRFAAVLDGAQSPWIAGGPLARAELERWVADARAVRAILESEDDDPRWESWPVEGGP